MLAELPETFHRHASEHEFLLNLDRRSKVLNLRHLFHDEQLSGTFWVSKNTDVMYTKVKEPDKIKYFNI
jgi:hypothetical protein